MHNIPGKAKWSAAQVIAFALLALVILGVGVLGFSQTDFFNKFSRSVTMIAGSESRAAEGGRLYGQRNGNGGYSHGGRGGFRGDGQRNRGFRGGGLQEHADGALPEGLSGGSSQRNGRPDRTAYGYGQVAGYAGILILVIAITALICRLLGRRCKTDPV
ncbi:MAG: hypothetical protein M0009_13310 [Deltaproteobacteria bacterium]|nr:hypothetical protein [Deltaproteobacteria bacterium]